MLLQMVTRGHYRMLKVLHDKQVVTTGSNKKLLHEVIICYFMEFQEGVTGYKRLLH